jgi:hypothetical protein
MLVRKVQYSVVSKWTGCLHIWHLEVVTSNMNQYVDTGVVPVPFDILCADNEGFV